MRVPALVSLGILGRSSSAPCSRSSGPLSPPARSRSHHQLKTETFENGYIIGSFCFNNFSPTETNLIIFKSNSSRCKRLSLATIECNVYFDEILTHLEIVEACSDSISMWSAGLDVLSQELSRADALPFEVLAQSLKVLLTACTWWSKKENSTNYEREKRRSYSSR